MLGDFCRVGGVSELLGQLAAGVVQLGLKVFDTSGDFDCPSAVSEMSSNLARHRRHGERQKVCSVLDVEAVDRMDQPHAGCLDQIVERLTAVSISAGDVFGQRQATLYDGVSLALMLV